MFKKSVIIMVIVTFLSVGAGCSLFTKVAVPPGCEKSLIYKVVPNPATADAALQLATYAGLKIAGKNNPEVFAVTRVVLTKIRDVVSTSKTYEDYITFAMNEVKALQKYNVVVLIATIYVPELKKPVPIDSCDSKLFVDNMNRLLWMVDAAEKGIDFGPTVQ